MNENSLEDTKVQPKEAALSICYKQSVAKLADFYSLNPAIGIFCFTFLNVDKLIT